MEQNKRGRRLKIRKETMQRLDNTALGDVAAGYGKTPLCSVRSDGVDCSTCFVETHCVSNGGFNSCY